MSGNHAKAQKSVPPLHSRTPLLMQLQVWTETLVRNIHTLHLKRESRLRYTIICFILVSPDIIGSNVIEETWSPASVPLTNEFRYNMTESLPFVPQSPSSGYERHVPQAFHYFYYIRSISFLTSYYVSIHNHIKINLCHYCEASLGTTRTANVPVSIAIVTRPTTCQQVRSFLSRGVNISLYYIVTKG